MNGPTPSPCKYCGCTDIRYKSSGGLARALCRNCHAEGPIVWWEDVAKGATPHETMTNRGNAAIAAWNTRAPDPKVQALVDALSLSASRLLRRAMDLGPGTSTFIETCEWADDARAALAAWKGGTTEAPQNPSGFTDALKALCSENCAALGDPPCWKLPELSQPCEQITPCADCLAGKAVQE